MRRFLTVLAAAVAVLTPTPALATSTDPPRVLLITAHPDDETLFNLGRFAERGCPMAVALVTNGEGGSVVQAIRSDYDPQRDADVLIEAVPGPDAWVRTPPAGPPRRRIATQTALAAQRRREFVSSMAIHRVTRVIFLSGLRNPDFDDNWDDGIRNWDRRRLRRELAHVADRFRPDLIVTLNPGEAWAHPQHVGLGRLVQRWYAAGRLGRARAVLGLREHAWYTESLTAQTGDLVLHRSAYSAVLRSTYADYWRRATSAYVSQSSHPIWLDARARAGLLPGYGAVDVIRQLDGRLGPLLRRNPPRRHAYTALPRTPRVSHE